MLRSYRNFSEVFNWKRRRGVREWTGVDLESRIAQTRLFFKLKSSKRRRRERNKKVEYVRRRFREKGEGEGRERKKGIGTKLFRQDVYANLFLPRPSFAISFLFRRLLLSRSILDEWRRQRDLCERTKRT